MKRRDIWRRRRGLYDERALCLTDRREIATNLRAIRQATSDKLSARAFCWAVLANFKTGLAVVPREEQR